MQNIPRMPILAKRKNVFENIFIAELASVSHDQDFKLNLFFSQLKSAFSYLWWKFFKSQTGQTPLINGEKKLCVYFVFQSFLVIS